MKVSGLIPDVVRANIESRMARLGRTQAEVSRLGEMAQGEFSKIVGQKRGANLRNLERIAKGLSTDNEPCTVLDLFRADPLYEDRVLHNPAQLRSWLNQWASEQANRLFRQIEPLLQGAGLTPHRDEAAIQAAANRLEEAEAGAAPTRDTPTIRAGKPAAGRAAPGRNPDQPARRPGK